MKKAWKYGISVLFIALFAVSALCGCVFTGSPGNGGYGGNGGNGGNGGGQSENPAPKSEFASGSGTESDPYVISEPYQWENINRHLSSCFELSADLNMGDMDNLSPIGRSDAPFTGYFNGKGHIIHSASMTAGGLFGTVSGGTVKNLNFRDSKVRVTSEFGGGFFSAVKMGALIENCHMRDITFSRDFGDYCGGLIGLVTSASTVHYCSAENIAFSWGAQSCKLGFLLGRMEGGTVEACWVTGTAKLSFGDISGVVCFMDSGTIRDCFVQVNASGVAQSISTVGRTRNGGKMEHVLCLCDFLECELNYDSRIKTPFASSNVPVESTVMYFEPSEIEKSNSILDSEWKL